MNVIDAIKSRRAYRSLDPVEITPELVEDLARCAQLAASCFNNQPWRFVFVYEPDQLMKMRAALSKGNEWIHRASLIIAVFSKPEYDCAMKDGREYYLFDTGMAVATLVLRATELGMVAHPIAGFKPEAVREILGIPPEMKIVTLVNVGRHALDIKPELSEKQIADEKTRPERMTLEKFVYHNRYPPAS
jgi:nitroreductase